MTNISIPLNNDERFQRCLELRKAGTIVVEYRAPHSSLDAMELQLKNLEEQAKGINDPDIQEMLGYFRDFVGLVKDHHLTPEALELTLKEFESPPKANP